MPKPKILHIEGGKHLYGGPYQVLSLMKQLHCRTIDNLLACPEGSGLAEAAKAAGIAVTEIPLRGELSLTALLSLQKIIRSWRPDIVHIHSRRGADLWGVIAARRNGIRFIVTRRVDNPEASWLARWRYKGATRVVGISEKICDVLSEAGVAREKILCIRSGVDVHEWQPSNGRDHLRQEFGIEADEPVVAMAAQFIQRKGHSTLLKAIPHVLQKHPRTRFLLLGQGPQRETIITQSREFGSRVLIPGFRKDLQQIIPECTVLAHPAQMEGLGVVILQAAASGIPVVAGRAGGIPEVVLEGDTGYLVDPLDHEALAARLNDIIGNQQLRELMGESARAFAEAELSTEVMAEKNYRLYLDILSEAEAR